MAFGQPLPMTTLADELKQHICALSIKSWETYSHSLQTIPESWLDTAKQMSSDMAISDSAGQALSNAQLMLRTINLSSQINKQTNSHDQNIGILLSTSVDAVTVNLASLMSGKTVVNLDKQNLVMAVRKADIKQIISSKKYFISLSDELTNHLKEVEVIFIEELEEKVNLVSKATNQLLIKILPIKLLQLYCCRSKNIDQAAAILYSQNNSDDTDGVMLSHRNLMINCKQLAHVLNTEESDVMMANLPLSNAFGYTVTTLLPLIEGIPLICLQTADNVLKISKSIAKYNATILISTPSVYQLFMKTDSIHPLMLESLRLVVSGTDRLNQTVRNGFKFKYQKNILEGYGTVETSPVASVNVPDKLDTSDWKVQYGNKTDTVGMPLPGTSFRIIDPDTKHDLAIGESGRVLIGGPQVMLGYYNDQLKTEQVLSEKNDIVWFQTDDLGFIDKDGYLTIKK